jgi:hypothetical protein
MWGFVQLQRSSQGMAPRNRLYVYGDLVARRCSMETPKCGPPRKDRFNCDVGSHAHMHVCFYTVQKKNRSHALQLPLDVVLGALVRELI